MAHHHKFCTGKKTKAVHSSLSKESLEWAEEFSIKSTSSKCVKSAKDVKDVKDPARVTQKPVKGKSNTIETKLFFKLKAHAIQECQILSL
jgi:hypothetical protein